MRYLYLDDFRRGISVSAIFCYDIAVLGTPQCPPLKVSDSFSVSSTEAINTTETELRPRCSVIFGPKGAFFSDKLHKRYRSYQEGTY